MADKVTLIGTYHYDQRGRQRLTRLLDHLKPNTVTIETNPKIASRVERIAAKIDSLSGYDLLELGIYAITIGMDLNQVKSTLRIEGYEYLAARDYCSKIGIPLVFADPLLEAFLDKNKERISGEVSEITKMTEADLRKAAEEFYRKPIVVSGDIVDDFAKRDEATERIIRSQNGHVVHIGGLIHMYANYENLFQKLRDLSPQRMRLNTADRLNYR